MPTPPSISPPNRVVSYSNYFHQVSPDRWRHTSGGHVASFYVANVTAKSVRPLIVTNANRPSTLMTDSAIYPKIGDEFENHHSVNHSANEYARLSGYVHTNTERRSFIGISPNSTSAITTVAASALKTPSAPQKRSGAAKASG